MKNVKPFGMLGIMALTAVSVFHRINKIRHIGPCSPELEYRYEIINANKSAIAECRKIHGDTKSTDYEIWCKYLQPHQSK